VRGRHLFAYWAEVLRESVMLDVIYGRYLYEGSDESVGRGQPFMTSTKNQVFDSPLPPVHIRPHGPGPLRGRPHAVDMQYTPLS